MLLDNGILSAQSVLFGGCTGWGVVTLLLATINDTSHLENGGKMGGLQVFFLLPKEMNVFFKPIANVLRLDYGSALLQWNRFSHTFANHPNTHRRTYTAAGRDKFSRVCMIPNFPISV